MQSPHLLPDRAVIRIAGDERRSFLQGLVTQDIDALSPEQAIFASLLTPQGKILFDFFLAEDGEAILIDCDAETAPALAKRLTLYKLRAKVEIGIDDALAVLSAESAADAPEGIAFEDPRLPAMGWRVLAKADGADASGDYDARRLRLGVPEFGKDYGSDAMFLLDVNYDALNGVSYKKGCFVGQEVTSRMKRKGEARRRALMVEFDGPPPEKGSPVEAGESTIGEILSGAEGRALALIRMDRRAKAEAAGAEPACGERPVRLSVPDYLEQA